jgi:hypothetical protein
MSTALNDLAHSALCVQALRPDVYTEDANGAAIDLVAADGGGFAVLTVGPIAVGTQVGGYVEECDDGQDWSGDPLASFTAVTTANAIRTISFRRTARYVRAVLTIGGTGSPEATAAVIVGQQRKQF